MSLLRLKDIVVTLFAPHLRAQALIDAAFDASRGEGDVPEADRVWLVTHLSSCASCRAKDADRRVLFEALRSMKAEAPMGFAGRVLLAARARGRAEEGAAREVVTDHRFVLGFLGSFVPASQRAIGALLVVSALGTLTVVVALRSRTDHEVKPGASEALTGGARLTAVDSPHFVVRAPGIGAAKARSQFAAIVRAHGGAFSDAGDAIIARIPRNQLLPMTQDLAGRGRYKMSKSDPGELPSTIDPIVVRFEIE